MAVSASAAEFYVAPNGDDTHPGTKEKPFATLERARDAVRVLKKKGLPEGGVTVRLKSGTHERKASFDLTVEDSGTKGAPVVYRAEQDVSAVLTGGLRIPSLKPVNDRAILARLPEQARGKVRCADLMALGVTDCGAVHPRGFGFKSAPVTEVFFNGSALPVARWPNTGFVKTGRVLAGRPTSRESGDYGPGTFEFRHQRLARWAKASDAYVFGYWRYLWADAALGVAEIDAKAGRVRLAQASPYGTEPGKPFYFFNLLEEIDRPGEWYLDRKQGVLYLWPPSDPAKATVEISLFNGPFIRMTGASHIAIEGLTFELGRGPAVQIKDGADCRIAGCTVRRIGGDAVLIAGGKRHGVVSCDLHTLGRGGVRINGGDRKTLDRGDHSVRNCHIYDFSRVDRTYTPAVNLDGVGHRIEHNRVHDSPGHGMRVNGNDHLVEFNEVYRVAMETDDQGGLDMWGDPTYRGNVIRYNYWHDIGPGNVHCGRAGVRLDDAICGVLVYGNIFVRCSRGRFGGVQIHGGKDNRIVNNIFYDCRYAVSFSRWGAARWIHTITKKLGAKVKNMSIGRPPYSERYPDLARLREGADVNHVNRNVIFKCAHAFANDGGIQKMAGNLITNKDPGFVNAAAGDFRLKKGAAVLKTGFQPVPFGKIGLYSDAYRRLEGVKDK
jgi:hypothetical protein